MFGTRKWFIPTRAFQTRLGRSVCKWREVYGQHECKIRSRWTRSSSDICLLENSYSPLSNIIYARFWIYSSIRTTAGGEEEAFFQEEGTRSISSFLGTKLIWITRSRFITMVDASHRFEPTVDHLSLQLGASTRIAKRQDAYCGMKRCCFSPVLFFSSCVFEQ